MASVIRCFVPPYLYLATSERWCWSRGRGILTELSLWYSIVYNYNGAQWYKQLLQVDRLDWALILLGLAIYLLSSSVSSVFMVLYIVFTLLVWPLASWAWWDWPFTWLTNHCSSVLPHCWLGHLTHKIAPEMTYHVSYYTIPYHTIPYHTLLCTAAGFDQV